MLFKNKKNKKNCKSSSKSFFLSLFDAASCSRDDLKKQTYLIAFPNLTYSLLPSLSLYKHIFEFKYSIGRPVAF
jgi:hypothetical protein